MDHILLNFCYKKNYKIYGIVRRTSLLYSHTRLDHIRNKINLRYGDLTDNSGLLNYIFSIITDNPNFEILEIYNLAAQSHVKISFEIPEYTANVDGIGVLRILEIVHSLPNKIKNKIKFYQAGTSEMYGKAVEIPQNETTPFNPISPYAAAKLYAFHIVKCYRQGYNLYAVNGILFNHESPRRGVNFLTMKVVKAIKEISNNTREYIELGNLYSKRDWGHAKDYVYGMWLMLQQDKPEDFVLATGKTYTVKEFVNKAFAYKGYTLKWYCENEGIEEYARDQKGIVRVKINSKYYRPCEVDLLLGDASKAETILKWKRHFDTLDKLIIDMFDGIIF